MRVSQYHTRPRNSDIFLKCVLHWRFGSINVASVLRQDICISQCETENVLKG